MSEKKDTESIRISQVLAGALAAITAAVLGSTMGFAGTVVGAGLASVITTVGGAIYLRSIQRTKERVVTVRDKVVARAGASSVTLVEERPADEGADPDAGVQGAAAGLAEGTGLETRTEVVGAGEGPDTRPGTQAGTRAVATPPVRRVLRWPALIGASVLAFAIGMLVIFGVEVVRGEPLSGGGSGTTLGRIVRVDDGGGDREQAPPATTTPTAPQTSAPTVTVTETVPPTGADAGQPPPPEESPDEPEPSAPATTTGGEPTGGVSVPPTGQSG